MSSTGILITGADGQLGLALCKKFPEAQTTDRTKLDISDKGSLENYDWSGITVIINAAAYTNVDGAESEEGRVAAWEINATGVSNLSEIAREKNMTLVHISSDYVFDGNKANHTESEKYSPISAYGSSKAAGDIIVSSLPKHYILRTSWVIGEGKNFVRTMLSLGQKGVSPSVVSDQVGRLTFTHTLSDAVKHLLSNDLPYGTYNVTNDGPTASWADITRVIFSMSGYNDLTVTNQTTDDYFKNKPDSAPRPLNSTLDLKKIISTGFKPEDWEVDLKKYLKKEITS